MTLDSSNGVRVRPIQHLNAVMAKYPCAGAMVQDFIDSRGRDVPGWPDWCFLPMAAWYAIVCRQHQTPRLSLNMMIELQKLAAIGSWRYSQGVYRIDSAVLAELADNPLLHEMPSEALFKLPEFSLYIETPGHEVFGTPTHGFWTHLEFDVNTGRPELRLLIDYDANFIGLPLHIGRWTIVEAMDRMLNEATHQALLSGHKMDTPSPDVVEAAANSIRGFVSIVGFLCSQLADIRADDLPNARPMRATPVRTRRGMRFFPAQKPRIWRVSMKPLDHLLTKFQPKAI